MNDWIRDILRQDMNLYRKYDKALARYILSLDDDYELIDLEIDGEEFKNLIVELAKEDKCLDEWIKERLEEFIEKNKGVKNEEVSKYTENMEDRTNRRCR